GLQEARNRADALQAEVVRQQAALDQATMAVQQAHRGAEALQADVAEQPAKVAEGQATLHGTEAAPDQVGGGKAQAEQATAKVAQAEAHVEELLLQLSYTRTTAPHAGLVSRKNVTEGQTVQPGQPLLAVADLKAVHVTANFKETQLRGMHIGSPAIF